MKLSLFLIVSSIICFQAVAAPITDFKEAQDNLYLKGIEFPENVLGQNHPYLRPSFHHLLDQQTNSRMSAGNELILLPDGKSYQKKLEMVKAAKSSIFLSVMSFQCDETGRQMTDALIEARKRGVDVRIILDVIYGRVIPIFNKCRRKLKKNDVKVTYSRHSFRLRSFAKMMHDKILVKDLTEGVIGGQNLMDINNLSMPTNLNYRDTDVWLKGPVLIDMALRNIKHWSEFTRSKDADPLVEEYISLLKEQEKDFEKQGLLGKKNYKKWLESPKGVCRMVGQEPVKKTYYLTNLYTLLARFSEYSITIETPELVKIKSDLAKERDKQIKSAAKRGVQVNFITNGDDLVESYKLLMEYTRSTMFPNGGLTGLMGKLAPAIGKRTGEKFLKETLEWVEDAPLVNIYKHHKFIHSKMSSFDGIINVVGSYNFDRHSATNNFETVIICIDDNFKEQVNRQLTFDFANSILHQ